MAKTLLWFDGFGSGGLEAPESTTGTPNVQTSIKHSGAYSLELAQGEIVEFDDAPAQKNPAGTGIYIGFYVRWADVTPGTETEFFRSDDAGAVLITLNLETDGDIRVDFNSGSASTISAPSLTNDVWHRFEIYFDSVASGDIDIDIDGVNVLNQSGKDMTATGNVSWHGFKNEDTALFYVDDFFIFRADSAADFLGADWAGLSPFNPQDPDATAFGTDALDTGNWDDMASIPFTDGSEASYTNTPKDGHDRCGQPTGLGTSVGMSILIRAYRGNGGGTTHNLRYGKNDGSDSTEDIALSLNVSIANYPTGITNTTSLFPQSAIDHVLLGFNVTGNRDIIITDMVAQILHLPSSGTTFEEDIVLARGQNTLVPVADLTRIGALTLSRGQNTLVPIADLTRAGLLTLSRGQNTLALAGNIDTPQAISLNKDLGSAWIGNIITPQALALAISNRTVSFVAGLLYADSIALARGQNTLVPTATLTRVGALSLGKDKGISFVSQLDAVGALSLGKDLGITVAGNILTPQSITLGNKDLGITLDGNLIIPQSLALGKDKGLSFLGGVGFAAVLSLAKDAGITLSTGLTRVGALSLSKDAGIALTAFLTRVGALSLNNVRVIALNGTIISPQSLTVGKDIGIVLDGNILTTQSLTFARDLGIAESAQVDFFAILSMAKFVAFIPTHTFIPGGAVLDTPIATGDITLIEDVTSILEIVEQATGNIVLIETPTGTLILDLTP